MLETVLLAMYVAAGTAVSVAAAIITARRARGKGRRPRLWGVLGFLFGVLAVAALAWLPQVRGEREG